MNIRVVRAVTAILGNMAAPWVTWAMGSVPWKAAAMLSMVAFFTTTHNLFTDVSPVEKEPLPAPKLPV